MTIHRSDASMLHPDGAQREQLENAMQASDAFRKFDAKSNCG
jgi:hypothetical protein